MWLVIGVSIGGGLLVIAAVTLLVIALCFAKGRNGGTTNNCKPCEQ